MRNEKFVALALVLLCLVFWALPGTAAEVDKKPGGGTPSLLKTTGTPEYSMFNVNNIASWFRSDGQQAFTPSNQSGVYFPRGTSTVIYKDGLIWGGKPFLDAAHTRPPAQQPIRVGGQSYGQTTNAGRVTGSGATAHRVLPSDPDVRMYRVRRDYLELKDEDVTRDAAELFHGGVAGDVTASDMAKIRAQYDTDWKEWPVAYGAPYVERNGTPGYQAPPAGTSAADLILKNYDEPGIAGADPNSPADQVLWTVCNDLDAGTSNSAYGSDPSGFEMQITVWGYKRTDALGNLFFRKLKVINKGLGTADAGYYFDSVYVAMWSDPDLGDYGDDLCGCDTTLSMGFVYNGQAVDGNFRQFSLPPPSLGYDFLQGPLVSGAPADSGVFNLRVVHGKKNLPMTSFCWFAAGSAISDPPQATYEGTLRWWRMLLGYVPDPSTRPWVRYPAPPGVTPGPFPLSGDPVTGKGLLDGLGSTYSFQPGDRRLSLQSGPFTFALGDTQEIVVGTVAGLGSDRLSSIAVMKFNDEFVQNTYNALFAVPKSPPQPDVSVTELDGKIILNWASNPQRIIDTEQKISQPGSYTFEGYNIYQFPSAGSTLADAFRILTYDKETDPAIILDRQFDQTTGLILQKPIQFGSNNGIQRQFTFTRDFVKGVDKLYNGTTYFLAVTAYTYSTTGFSPAALESSPILLRVTPQLPKPGVRLGGAAGDTVKNIVKVTLPGGSQSDGTVTPIIVEPLKLTGHNYTVSFRDTPDGTVWDLADATLGKVLLKDQANQSDDGNYYVVDGMMVKVAGPSPGMKAWQALPAAANRRFSPVGGFIGLGLEGFSTGGDPNAAQDPAAGTIGMAGNFAFGGIATSLTVAQYHNVQLRLAAVNHTTLWDPKATPTDPNFSKAYRYLRSVATGGTAADPSFAPWIINRGSGYVYQDYNYGVPFSAWDMETTPPTRLSVGMFENNVVGGLVDGRYWPGLTDVDNSIPREFCFIWSKPYTETSDPLLALTTAPGLQNSTTPMMWVMTCARRADVDWAAGDLFNILANHVNTPLTPFQFAAPLTSSTADLAKVDAGKINVFPNPYYAFNPNETSQLAKFMMFNGLPQRATIRIFNLAGQQVRVITKSEPTQFAQWDLLNADGFPVASGIYVAYIDMPDIGAIKVLKLAVIQEQEVPRVY